MSSLDTLRELDADLHAAFLDSGLADFAHYSAPGANVDVDCPVYIDRAVRILGEFGQVVGHRDEVTILRRADLEPQKGGKVYVPAEALTYTLTDKIEDDGSASRWAVRRG